MQIMTTPMSIRRSWIVLVAAMVLCATTAYAEEIVVERQPADREVAAEVTADLRQALGAQQYEWEGEAPPSVDLILQSLCLSAEEAADSEGSEFAFRRRAFYRIRAANAVMEAHPNLPTDRAGLSDFFDAVPRIRDVFFGATPYSGALNTYDELKAAAAAVGAESFECPELRGRLGSIDFADEDALAIERDLVEVCSFFDARRDVAYRDPAGQRAMAQELEPSFTAPSLTRYFRLSAYPLPIVPLDVLAQLGGEETADSWHCPGLSEQMPTEDALIRDATRICPAAGAVDEATGVHSLERLSRQTYRQLSSPYLLHRLAWIQESPPSLREPRWDAYVAPLVGEVECSTIRSWVLEPDAE
jgi:hypothetical protein